MIGFDVDTSDLETAVRRLAGGLDEVATDEPVLAARRVAGELAGRLPVRSGRLAASVRVVDQTGGAGVSYGAGVPYAAYIDRRTGAVAASVDGADRTYAAACERGAAREVGRL